MDITIDKNLAIKLITEHYGEKAASTVDVLGEGHWSKAFAFTTHGVEYVLRIGAHLDDFQKDARAATFSNASLPIPIISAIGPCDAGWYVVSERCYGTFLDDLTADEWELVVPNYSQRWMPCAM